MLFILRIRIWCTTEAKEEMETLWESRVNEESQIKAAIKLLFELVRVSWVRVFDGLKQLSVADCQWQVSIRLTEENVDNPEARKNEFRKTANLNKWFQHWSHRSLVVIVSVIKSEYVGMNDDVIELKIVSVAVLKGFDCSRGHKFGLPRVWEQRRVINFKLIQLKLLSRHGEVFLLSVDLRVGMNDRVTTKLLLTVRREVVLFVAIVWGSINKRVVFKYVRLHASLLGTDAIQVVQQEFIDFFIRFAPITVCGSVQAIG